jgi:hypothetical protein
VAFLISTGLIHIATIPFPDHVGLCHNAIFFSASKNRIFQVPSIILCWTPDKPSVFLKRPHLDQLVLLVRHFSFSLKKPFTDQEITFSFTLPGQQLCPPVQEEALPLDC